MIYPTFRNFETLLVLLFKLGRNYFTRIFFNKHYLSFVEFKDFNAKIDSNLLFDQSPKTNKKPKKNSLKWPELMTI